MSNDPILIVQYPDVTAVAKQISETMYEFGIDYYMQQDDFQRADAELLFEICFEKWSEANGPVPEPFEDSIREAIDEDIEDIITSEVRQLTRDRELYQRDPLAYYGMSQKDFL